MKLRCLLLTLIPISAFADDIEFTSDAWCTWMGQRMPCAEAANQLVLWLGPWLWPIVASILLVCIFLGICWWKIFHKASQPGWAAFIPIYNLVIRLRIAKMSGWWVLLYWIPVIPIVMFYRISRSFGHEIGFSLGLFILDLIFVPILAFNDDKYNPNANAKQPQGTP